MENLEFIRPFIHVVVLSSLTSVIIFSLIKLFEYYKTQKQHAQFIQDWKKEFYK